MPVPTKKQNWVFTNFEVAFFMLSFSLRGGPWNYSHSRTLCWFSETIPGVSEVPSEGPTCRTGEHPAVSQRHLWQSLHRPQASQVSVGFSNTLRLKSCFYYMTFCLNYPDTLKWSCTHSVSCSFTFQLTFSVAQSLILSQMPSQVHRVFWVFDLVSASFAHGMWFVCWPVFSPKSKIFPFC